MSSGISGHQASLVTQSIKVTQSINTPANARDVGLIPGLGRSPGEGNGTHSSILSWEIPWTEESG